MVSEAIRLEAFCRQRRAQEEEEGSGDPAQEGDWLQERDHY